ncbi:glycosyltransferase family 2 protein [Intestinibacter bartlettii]|uniref:glycosyltransferase family 2 protein n=1 Tax=Intestinibacter bartlettii TaxID=261299 RepID=UPI0026DB7C6E|nr:glycosyltransferase family 2 protein [Intestinibacter bartlettii]
MYPLVSIIVPIYKVENYLNRCIDSIRNQTYKNLEIILVDDGSPDKCGDMADKYASMDDRIKSVHKTNGGLSDARNYGMKYVTGEYVFFLDSDDYLKLDAIEYLVNIMTKYDADIVQGSFYYSYEDYLLYDDRYYCEEDGEVILDRNSLMKELTINERVKNFAWGKLYKTKLINDLPFRKGVLFEDVYWAHLVMNRVNKYIITHKPIVYYTQRNDSISGNYNPKNTDIIWGLLERHKFLESNYTELISESYKIIFKTMLIHYNLLSKNQGKENSKKYMKDIRDYININYDKMHKCFSNEKEIKNKLVLFKLNPHICYLYELYNKILRKLNIKEKEKTLKRIDKNG